MFLKKISWLSLLTLLALPMVRSHAGDSSLPQEPTPAELEQELKQMAPWEFDYIAPNATENADPEAAEPLLVPAPGKSILIVVHKNVPAGEKQYVEAFFDKESTPFFNELVSTGKSGHSTPSGTYNVQKMVKDYWSQTYNAPMPWSIFFKAGYAIHGTDPAFYPQLGMPASHGCVRLHRANAQELYETVKANGPANTSIIIQ